MTDAYGNRTGEVKCDEVIENVMMFIIKLSEIKASGATSSIRGMNILFDHLGNYYIISFMVIVFTISEHGYMNRSSASYRSDQSW